MDDLILRSLRGEISNVEERRLQKWRTASPDNERRYRQLARVWQLEAPRVSGEIPPRPQLEAIIRQAEHRRATSVPQHRRWTTDRGRWLPRVAAAAAILVLGLSLMHLWSALPAVDTFGAAEFVTGKAERVTVRLNDGSVVRLAPQTRLRVSGMEATREVWLDGRAFFAVAEQKNRPFVVRTRAGEAVVLGTRFEVRVDDDDLRVVVVEGRVALSASGETVEVGAGEVSHAAAGSVPAVQPVDDVAPLLDWMGPFLVFQATPLDRVAEEIERHYDIRVDLPDSTLATRTVTAWFTDESAEEVLSVVCRVVDAHCSIGNSVASIEP